MCHITVWHTVTVLWTELGWDDNTSAYLDTLRWKKKKPEILDSNTKSTLGISEEYIDKYR